MSQLTPVTATDRPAARSAGTDAARQVTALHPAANLFSPGLSLLVLLAWPAAALAVAAILITRRDI